MTLDDRIARLESMSASEGIWPRSACDEMLSVIRELVKQRDMAVGTNKALREAMFSLNQYAQHDDDCGINIFSPNGTNCCTCGYRDAWKASLKIMDKQALAQIRGEKGEV